MKELLLRYLAIGFAGSLGAIARYAVASQVGRLNYRFPLGTFIINITGSIFLGWFLTHIERHQVSDVTRLAIGVGFVGAYTTFSTFMYESNKLADDGAGFLAMMNIAASLVVGILGVRLGILLGKWA
jgi:fluoride exporter